MIKGRSCIFSLQHLLISSVLGWDEGIPGMLASGERLLIVPPKLGYGNRKIDGIPAGSTLRFGKSTYVRGNDYFLISLFSEVKLLEVK